MLVNIKRFYLMLVCCFAITDILACPKGTVKLLVNNTFDKVLHLESRDEKICKLNTIAMVVPGMKSKYCVSNKSILRVTTLSGKGAKKLAISEIGLEEDLMLSTPIKIFPDVEFHHVASINSDKLENGIFVKEELKVNKVLKKKKKSIKKSIKKSVRKVDVPSLLD